MIALEEYIKTRNVYFDKKSFEKRIKKTRRKYKLAGNTFPLELEVDFFYFFILMSSISACQKFLTIEVKESEWINRNLEYPDYFRERSSFIDINKIEKLSAKEIRSKINDKKNGFLYIAELPRDKFKKLQNYRKFRMPASYKPIPSDIQKMTRMALAEDMNEAIRKFGI